MGPAVLWVASRFGLLEPKTCCQFLVVGAGSALAIVRWPGPILVVSCGSRLIGLLALPGYKVT